MCQCQYSETFISNGQFFCGNSKKQVIYQAQLLITDGKTAEEIRNITQKWVLTKPFITISGKSYQLDPYCSVVIKEFGDITCDAVSPTQLESSVESSTYLLVYSVVVGVLLLLAITGVVILMLCFIMR